LKRKKGKNIVMDPGLIMAVRSALRTVTWKSKALRLAAEELFESEILINGLEDETIGSREMGFQYQSKEDWIQEHIDAWERDARDEYEFIEMARDAEVANELRAIASDGGYHNRNENWDTKEVDKNG
jgi:hypothetical protein